MKLKLWGDKVAILTEDFLHTTVSIQNLSVAAYKDQKELTSTPPIDRLLQKQENRSGVVQAITVAEITGCDLLREASILELQNVMSDINRNGKHLLALWQALDFKIVNGRVGSDKYFGRSACHKTDAASVIDYAIASEYMLPYISHFNVEMFDPCFFRCPLSSCIWIFMLYNCIFPMYIR